MAGSRLPTGAYTFECWFNLSSFKPENHLFSQFIASQPGRTIFFVNNTPKMDFFIGGQHCKNTTTTIQPNTWYHVACVRDDQLTTTTGRLYINGVLETTWTSFPKVAAENVDNYLGFSTGDTVNGGFNGAISEVRVWNTARTQEEIVANMNRRLNGNEAGLWHYWPCDEGSGTTVADCATTGLATPCNGVSVSGSAGITWRQDNDLPLANLNDAAWAVADGSWSSAGNWLGRNLPGTDSVAYFTNNAAAFTVTADTAATVSGLYLNTPGGVTFQGSPFTLQSNGSIILSGGSAVLNNGLNVPGALSLTASSGTSLALLGAVGGAGAITSSGGIVSLPNATGLTGGLNITAGTVENAGLDAPLTMGRATFRVTADTTYAQPISRSTGHGNYATVFDVPTNVTATVSGKLERGVGALLKTGGGTLRLTYPGTQYLSDGANAGAALVVLDADGNGPTDGCFGTTIANGKLLLDGGTRQTNIVQNGRFPIGICTTADGTETTGELEIRSGTLLYSPLYANSMTIGRNNGKTANAPDGLSPTLTISGGEFIGPWVIALGYYEANNNPVGITAANTTCRPVMRMTDGRVDTAELRLSESVGITSSVTIGGGELYVRNRIDIGFSSNTVSTLTVNNGAVYATNALIIMTRADAGGSTATLNLNGGAVFAQNIRHYGDDTCTSRLYLNGGTFYPTAANTLTGLTEAVVGVRGAIIDTTHSDFTIAQQLLHDSELWQSDGGLTKYGENTLTVNVADECTYDGPTTVMTGTLRVINGLPSSTRLVIESGSTLQLGGASGGIVSADSITLGPSSTVAFEFSQDSQCDALSLGDASGLTGSLDIRLLQTDGQDFSQDGTYTLFWFNEKTPSEGDEGIPDVSAFHVANAVYGKSYYFTVTDDNRVTLTIEVDNSCAVWNRDANGQWNRNAYWTAYPGNYAGAMARFDSVITAPRSITVNGITAGALWFNNVFAYTLEGNGFTLENSPAGEPAYITVESGSHAITAPLTLASPLAFAFTEGTGFTLGEVSGSGKAISSVGSGTLTLAGDLTASSITLDKTELSASGTRTVTASLNSPGTLTVRPETSASLTVEGVVNATNLTKSGASILNLTDAVSVSGRTTIDGGTLSLAEPVASAVTLGRATLHVTENMTLPGTFTRSTGNNNYGAVIAVDEEKELTLSGRQYVTSGALVKTGGGTLRYTYNGTQTINNYANDAPYAPIGIGVNGEGPTGNCVGITVAEGRVIFDAPLQTNNVVGGRIVIGGSTTTRAGAETAGELEVRQGTLIPGAAITVGRNNGNTTTAPDGLESKLLVTGGKVISGGTVAVGWWDGNRTDFTASTITERPWIIVTNGLLQAATLRIAEGSGVGPATLDVSGGTVCWSGTEGLTVGYGANSIAVCNLSGSGLIESTDTSTQKNIKLTGGNAGANGTLNLNGGTLRCGNIVKGGSAANCTSVVNFNGGTFRPIVDAQTLTGLTSATVSTNGAVFDLSEVAAFTVAQPLLHNEAATTDGGVIKRGAGTLTLSATTSTFNGPLKVESGTLVAAVCSTNALDISAGAIFDANGETALVGDLSGCGTTRNGTLAVTGRIAPGTNASGQSTLTVDTLRLDAGATFVCDWNERGGDYTCPTLAVGSSLTFAGRGTVDFGMGSDGAVLPSGFSCVLMTYEAGAIAEGTETIWSSVNTGAASPMNAVLTARNGKVTVTLRSSGTVLSIR